MAPLIFLYWRGTYVVDEAAYLCALGPFDIIEFFSAWYLVSQITSLPYLSTTLSYRGHGNPSQDYKEPYIRGFGANKMSSA